LNKYEQMPRTTYHVSLTPAPAAVSEPPFSDQYPVRLCDGSVLRLPIQALPGGDQAIALLMSNQTPFAVEAHISALLAGVADQFGPQAIAGIPTLGLDYARLVAKTLGFPDYVPLGNSRKFWYSDDLSVPVESVTSVGAQRRLYIDPAIVARVAGKRVLVVDDVINTGGSASAAVSLLQRAGADVVGLAVVLVEGAAWKPVMGAFAPDWPGRVKGLGAIPIFRRGPGGWYPIP
jgi:adenine/guanine phosphoribosyltransferase-like PRPP-binding protein